MNLVLLAGSIVVTGLVFIWLFRILKATFTTALLIAAIVFGLQLLGIRSDQLLYEIQGIFRSIWRMIPGQQSYQLDGIVHEVAKAAHSALELFSS